VVCFCQLTENAAPAETSGAGTALAGVTGTENWGRPKRLVWYCNSIGVADQNGSEMGPVWPLAVADALAKVTVPKLASGRAEQFPR
jgi:hypothetical protein